MSKKELNERYSPELSRLSELIDLARKACDLFLSETKNKTRPKTITSKEVGDTLEQVVHYIFSCTGGVFVPYGASSTNMSQLDNTTEVTLKQGFLDRWPPYAIIECKNWAGKVGKTEVSDFIKKVEDGNAHVGILFARKGITGSQYRDAEGKLTLAANRKTIIMIFTDTHLDELCSGKNLFDILEREYRSRCLSCS